MQTVYVIDAVRTAIGKYGGALSSVRPDDLLAHVIKVLLSRNAAIDVNAIEDVIAGLPIKAGKIIAMWPVWPAVGRSAQYRGRKYREPVVRKRFAGHHGCQPGDCLRRWAPDDRLRVESMSRAPFVMPKSTSAFAGNRR